MSSKSVLPRSHLLKPFEIAKIARRILLIRRLLSGKSANWKEKNQLAKFQLIVSDPVSKTSKAASLEGTKAQALVGKSIGEEIDGKLLGLGNVKLRITGGTDKDGVPMRFDIQGAARKRAMLSGGVGYKPDNDGERQRRLVRGRTISEETLQVNSVIVSGTASVPAPSPEAAKA